MCWPLSKLLVLGRLQTEKFEHKKLSLMNKERKNGRKKRLERRHKGSAK